MTPTTTFDEQFAAYGAWECQGCVCHHPWTLAMRAAS